MADENPNVNYDPELDAVRTKLAATEQELNNYKLKLADFDNTRKRMFRDLEIERKYATEGLARDLLSALDNLDRALEAAKRAGDTGPLATGVSVTASQFLDALKRHGITRIEVAPGTVLDDRWPRASRSPPASSSTRSSATGSPASKSLREPSSTPTSTRP
jgi:molecular chaperone GrpE